MEKFDFVDSKFRYAIIAAKRAKQIVKGSKKRIDTEYQNPLNIAIDEVAHGKVQFEVINRDELDFTEMMEDTFDTPSNSEIALQEDESQQVSDMKDILLGDNSPNADDNEEVAVADAVVDEAYNDDSYSEDTSAEEGIDESGEDDEEFD